MHILCTICSDLVNPAENIHVTKCGHIFHYHCLSQWILRSKSCPQCRTKVTEKCIFRMYPTISNESSGDDAATLQSRLDDAQLQLRQHKAIFTEKDGKVAELTANLKKNEELLKACEKKLVTRESAVSALKEQLDYVKIQNNETQKIKEENECLKKNIQTLNGLQKVLNATNEEVEQMLTGYTDVRTVATFATALKRALCESESKKRESRDRLVAAKQALANEKMQVAELRTKVAQLEEKCANLSRQQENIKHKRKISDVADKSLFEESWESAVKQMRPSNESERLDDAILAHDNNGSFNTIVKRIEDADSPYLNLKQSSLALVALQQRPKANAAFEAKLKPSEFALLNSARNASKKNANENIPTNCLTPLSIFHKKEPPRLLIESEHKDFDISYDGLGGHSKLDVFPVPNVRPPLKSCVPKLTAKHKLKRPNPAGSQDIGKMLAMLNDK